MWNVGVSVNKSGGQWTEAIFRSKNQFFYFQVQNDAVKRKSEPTLIILHQTII